MSGAHGVAGCEWGGGDWVSVDRRLFHRCGASGELPILLRHVILINFSSVTNYEHYL